ncbi:MAG: beta-lactamase [Desulfobulbaceae bacterium BRH_c16a]|nr:MAG: beta-lactamase [Desulfobulbaceae bacterium BRH_c16a]
MKVRFWGVRGSIPSPGPKTQKYGGNTACIELRVGPDNRLIIIDAGSGIRTLGNSIMANDLPKGPIRADIFLSHTHWDHIMGYPFFTPIYIPGTKLKVYGPVSFEEDPLEEVVGGQMKYRYFPVNLGELASEIEYIRLKEDPSIDLSDGLQLRTKLLNHPITALGYRFEYGKKAVCTCYDTEPFRNLFITDPAHPAYDEAMALEGEEVAIEQNLAVEQFFAGADLLIYDAQYTAAEYGARINWGHTAMEYAIEAANRAGVKRLALFHHDPDRADATLDELAEVYCLPGKYGKTEVFFAREGMVIDL